jgi:hypothetical protein
MLARFLIKLPFLITMPADAQYQLRSFQVDGYVVRIDLPARYEDSPSPKEQVTIDGKPTVHYDVLRLEFKKESINRGNGAPLDPPEGLVRDLIEWFVGRLRYLTKSAEVVAPSFPTCAWNMRYLNDDGSELQIEEGKYRARHGVPYSFAYRFCDPDLWDFMFALPPSFEPPTWHTLLLDARDALPHVGTALVLAATAMEVFISELLNKLVKDTAVPKPLWEWINDRRDHYKEPSVDEQFDHLLKLMVGHSLKEDTDLWNALMDMKNARNRFVHEGVARIKNSPTAVSESDALKLIARAEEITTRIREWIPEAHRWPIYESKSKLEIIASLFTLVPEATPSGDTAAS